MSNYNDILSCRRVSVRRASGFTVLELLFVVAIAAIVLAMSVPSFAAIVKRNRINAEMHEFVSTLNAARSEAVMRNTRTTVCRSANGSSCGGDWEDGWIVFTDSANIGTVDNGEEILLVADGLDQFRYSLRGSDNISHRISFGPEGFSVGSNGEMVLCYDEDNDGSGDFDDANAKVVSIANSGRIQTLYASDSEVSATGCSP